MANKPESKRTTSSSSKFLSPRLSTKSRISVSCIHLNQGYTVKYAHYTASHSSVGHAAVDSARRTIFLQNSGKSLENSLLTYSQVSDTTSSLWIYSIESSSENSDAFPNSPTGKFQDIELPGLTSSGNGIFSYTDLYPCLCSRIENLFPCSTCNSYSNSDPSSARDDNEGHSIPLTFHSLKAEIRTVYLFFLDAIRERLINDICEHAQSLGNVARRLCKGIIWGFPCTNKAWGTGWEQHAHHRCLSFSHIRITLVPSGILIQPHVQATQFLPLCCSLPPLPGTPINLLPFSTPAFYLNTYEGPTHGLAKQFETHLIGLGTGNCFSLSEASDMCSQFVIAWIDVRNEQGADRGLVVIWPTSLCITLSSCNHPSRKPLTYIPELPITLQASPIPAPATVPIPVDNIVITPQNSSTSPSLESSAPLAPELFSVNTAILFSTFEKYGTTRPYTGPPNSTHVQYVDLNFRSSASNLVESCNMRGLSMEIGRYVDSVAKERERERERIKKEKDMGTVPGVKIPGFHELSIDPLTKLDDDFMGNDYVQQYASQSLDNIASLLQNPMMTPVEMQQSQLSAQSDSNQSSISQLAYPSPPEEILRTDKAGLPDKPVLKLPDNESLQEGDTKIDVQSSEHTDGPYAAVNLLDVVDEVVASYNPPGDFSHAAMNYDFESLRTFTEDDFDFFDSPMGTVDQLALRQASAYINDNTAVSVSFPDLFSGGIEAQLSTPSAEALINVHSSSDYPSSGDLDILPMTETTKHEVDTTPTETPNSSVSSPTLSISPIPKLLSPCKVTQDFRPIPLTVNDHSMDAKYAMGKFSTQVSTYRDAKKSYIPDVWATEYANATDPRFTIRRRLLEAKERDEIRVNELPHNPSYFDTQWDICMDDDTAVTEMESQYYSDNDDSENMEYESISRAMTPLPTHLPLGPTLLPTRFSYPLLLPLSTNLKPSGISSVVLGSPSPIPNPVPTPISPAAVSNSDNERYTVQENILLFLVNELAENSLWACSCKARLKNQMRSLGSHSGMEREDNLFNENFLFSSGWIWSPIEINTYASVVANRHKPTLFDEPRFVVGKSDVIIHVSPSAIRFWNKLGLSPRSGIKNVCGLLFYDSIKSESAAEQWLGRVSSIYSTKGYGEHKIGYDRPGLQKGLLPIHFSDFQKSLENVISMIGESSDVFLLYVAIPGPLIFAKSPIFHQILSSIVSTKSVDGSRVHLHLVPDFLIGIGVDEDTSLALQTLVDEVYDRIRRFVSGNIVDPSTQVSYQTFQAPAFCLAEESRKVQYSYRSINRGNNPLERHTFLQVGYRLSECQKWLVVACTDQRGEVYSSQIWHTPEPNDYKQMISRIWEIVSKYLSMADVEWRIAIAKLGDLDEFELQAWNTLFNSVSAGSWHIPFHVSLLSIDNSGWIPLSHELSPAADLPGKGRTISSSDFMCMLPLYCLPPSPLCNNSLGNQQSICIDDSVAENSSFHLRPLRSAILIDSPSNPQQSPSSALYIHLFQVAATPNSTLRKSYSQNLEDICHNCHDLAILNKNRQKYSNTKHRYPYHLAVLCLLEDVLELCDGPIDR